MARKKEDRPLKVDEQEHERLKTIGFQKGQSGNPNGRPPIPAAIKEAMASYTLEAIETLVNVMRSSENDAAKVKAATHILGPFVSKAPQQVEVDVQVSSFGDFLVQANRRHKLIKHTETETLTLTVDAKDVTPVDDAK